MSTEDQKAREAFEKWMLARSAHAGLARYATKPSDYKVSGVQLAWESWQAGRRDMSITGPETTVSDSVSTPLRPVEGVDHLSIRRAALEAAAKAVEDMRDLKESARAQKAADEAISRDDKDDMLHRLRHCSTVSLFNGALERAAKAIRALADPLQGKETQHGTV